MKSTIKHNLDRALKWSAFFGFDPIRLFENIRHSPAFISDLKRYSDLNSNPAFGIRIRGLYPILHERRANAGVAGGHYFHQDLWAARKIFRQRPLQHIDVGSRIDGFVAHLLVFMPVTVVDIRPMETRVSGLAFIKDDATDLKAFSDDSIDSLSSLHAAEHFGLGRYSDPIDPDACFRFMRALQRVLAPGGHLYFSVPIGRERVEFNAHRVFETRTILKHFSSLNLASFSFVADDGIYYENIDPACIPTGGNYSCGLFEFTKPAS